MIKSIPSNIIGELNDSGTMFQVCRNGGIPISSAFVLFEYVKNHWREKQRLLKQSGENDPMKWVTCGNDVVKDIETMYIDLHNELRFVKLFREKEKETDSESQNDNEMNESYYSEEEYDVDNDRIM